MKKDRVIKEAFFVQVKTPDNALEYFDETSRLGRKSAYQRPEGTCALRVSENGIVFSVLKHTKKSRAQAAEQNLELPLGPLARGQRLLASADELEDGQVLVDIEGVQYLLRWAVDSSGVLTLDAGDAEELFTLPPGRMRLSAVWRPVKGKRPVVVLYQGHVGKPGGEETASRALSIVCQLLTVLAPFSLFTGITSVRVPQSSARYIATRPQVKESDRPRKTIVAHLWPPDGNAGALTPPEGIEVSIELDLDQANPVSRQFLFHFDVPEQYREVFEPMRAPLNDAVLSAVKQYLDTDEITELVISLVLGELSDGDLERLRNAVALVPNLNLTADRWAPIP